MTNTDNTLPSHTILLGVTNSPSSSNFQDFRLFLDDCLRNPQYQQHSEGLFNGVYYILQKFDEEELPIGNTVAKTKYGTVDQYGDTMDFRTRVKECFSYLTLKDAYKRVSENVSVSSQHTIKMKSDDKLSNFRCSPNLNQNGKYV